MSNPEPGSHDLSSQQVSKGCAAPKFKTRSERTIDTAGESLAELSDRVLYIVLRKYPRQISGFHWSYSFHKDANVGGIKYSLKNKPGSGIACIPNHGPTVNNILFSPDILISIAHVPKGNEKQLDKAMRAFDTRLRANPTDTSELWLLDIMRTIVLEGMVTVVHLSTVTDIRKECSNIGNQHRNSALQGSRELYLVETSRVCVINN